MFGRRKLALLVAEFLGTGVLAFTVLNVSHSTLGIPYFVAFAVGLVVALMGLGLAQDVQLNPALTLGLWTARQIKTTKAAAYIAVQLLGGWAAYALYKYFTNTPVQGLPHTFDSRILVGEAVGAFVFMFLASGVGFQKRLPVIRATTAGGALALGVIVASVASPGSFLNPAVALAAHSWVWGTYVLGPVLGGVIGVNLYGLLFAPSKAELAAASTKSKK